MSPSPSRAASATYDQRVAAAGAAADLAVARAAHTAWKLLGAIVHHWEPAATHVGLVWIDGDCSVQELVTAQGSHNCDSPLVTAVQLHSAAACRRLAPADPADLPGFTRHVGLSGALLQLPQPPRPAPLDPVTLHEQPLGDTPPTATNLRHGYPPDDNGARWVLFPADDNTASGSPLDPDTVRRRSRSLLTSAD